MKAGKASAALKFVLLIGVMSFFADFTYEGARSITGPFLALLGATGAVVGLVSGFGELLGYGLRIFSGQLSERTADSGRLLFLDMLFRCLLFLCWR